MRLQLLERLISLVSKSYFISIVSSVIGIKCNMHAQVLSMC